MQSKANEQRENKIIMKTSNSLGMMNVEMREDEEMVLYVVSMFYIFHRNFVVYML